MRGLWTPPVTLFTAAWPLSEWCCWRRPYTH